jgi:hypothetical protein
VLCAGSDAAAPAEAEAEEAEEAEGVDAEAEAEEAEGTEADAEAEGAEGAEAEAEGVLLELALLALFAPRLSRKASGTCIAASITPTSPLRSASDVCVCVGVCECV